MENQVNLGLTPGTPYPQLLVNFENVFYIVKSTWVGGWVGGWVDVKAVLRIAHSNLQI